MRGLCPYRVDIVKKGENLSLLYNLNECSLLSHFLDEKLESKILDLVFNFERAKVPFFLFVCLFVCLLWFFIFVLKRTDTSYYVIVSDFYSYLFVARKTNRKSWPRGTILVCHAIVPGSILAHSTNFFLRFFFCIRTRASHFCERF